MWWIYLIREIDSGAVKIGVADDPESRLVDLQCGTPRTLEVLHTTPVGEERNAAFRLETRLHRLCSEFHIRGEWFTSGAIEAALDELSHPERWPDPYKHDYRKYGKPRTAEDRHRAVNVLLADPEWSQWSDEKIGAHVGVDPNVVRIYRMCFNNEASNECH